MPAGLCSTTKPQLLRALKRNTGFFPPAVSLSDLPPSLPPPADFPTQRGVLQWRHRGMKWDSRFLPLQPPEHVLTCGWRLPGCRMTTAAPYVSVPSPGVSVGLLVLVGSRADSTGLHYFIRLHHCMISEERGSFDWGHGNGPYCLFVFNYCY